MVDHCLLRSRYFKAFFLLIIVYFYSGCRTERQWVELEWYTGKGNALRGFPLGTSLDSIRTGERAKILHDDSLGIAFRLDRSDSTRMEIEYYARQGVLKATVVNIYVVNEKKAGQLYKKLVEYYSEEWERSPEGAFGNYSWTMAKERFYLRLLPDRQTITLNRIMLPG